MTGFVPFLENFCSNETLYFGRRWTSEYVCYTPAFVTAKFCSNFKDHLCILYVFVYIHTWKGLCLGIWRGEALIKMIYDCKGYSLSYLIILCTCCLEKNIFFLFCPFISNRIIVPSRLAKISLHSSPFPLPMLKSPQPQNTICWDLKCIFEHGRCCHTVSNRSQEHK